MKIERQANTSRDADVVKGLAVGVRFRLALVYGLTTEAVRRAVRNAL